MAGYVYHISPDYHDDGPGCPIRRLRRAPHISNELGWVYHSYLQVDVEAGLGTNTGPGSEPQLILRYSNDGGKTWGNDRKGSALKLGEFSTRVNFRRLSRSRDRVYEMVTSDPVPWRIVDAYLKVEGGTD